MFGIFKRNFNRINLYQSGHFERYVYLRAHYYEKNDIISRSYSFSILFILSYKIFNYFFNHLFLNY